MRLIVLIGQVSRCRSASVFSQWEQVLELVRSVPQKDVIQLGRGMPDVTTPTLKPLLRSLAQISRRLDLPGLYYDNVHGVLALREQLGRLLPEYSTG